MQFLALSPDYNVLLTLPLHCYLFWDELLYMAGVGGLCWWWVTHCLLCQVDILLANFCCPPLNKRYTLYLHCTCYVELPTSTTDCHQNHGQPPLYPAGHQHSFSDGQSGVSSAGYTLSNLFLPYLPTGLSISNLFLPDLAKYCLFFFFTTEPDLHLVPMAQFSP